VLGTAGRVVRGIAADASGGCFAVGVAGVMGDWDIAYWRIDAEGVPTLGDVYDYRATVLDLMPHKLPRPGQRRADRRRRRVGRRLEPGSARGRHDSHARRPRADGPAHRRARRPRDRRADGRPVVAQRVLRRGTPPGGSARRRLRLRSDVRPVPDRDLALHRGRASARGTRKRTRTTAWPTAATSCSTARGARSWRAP
jgi:hypothetical protein